MEGGDGEDPGVGGTSGVEGGDSEDPVVTRRKIELADDDVSHFMRSHLLVLDRRRPSSFTFARARTMGTAADAGGGDGEDVEVYANGVAFDVVKGWLGKEGSDLDWNSWYGAEDVDGDRPARQERLGLGAKFLPHSRAVQLMGGVQKKLGKAIAQSRRRADEEDEDEDASAARRGGSASWRAKPRGGLASGGGGRPGASAAAARGGDDSDSDSDSDGGGRAAASFKGSAAKRKATAPWDPTKDPALLRGAPGSSAKKKKKKKK